MAVVRVQEVAALVGAESGPEAAGAAQVVEVGAQAERYQPAQC